MGRKSKIQGKSSLLGRSNGGLGPWGPLGPLGLKYVEALLLIHAFSRHQKLTILKAWGPRSLIPLFKLSAFRTFVVREGTPFCTPSPNHLATQVPLVPMLTTPLIFRAKITVQIAQNPSQALKRSPQDRIHNGA